MKPGLTPFDWRGSVVVCMASGPSLTAEDAERVRESGLVTVVTNSTWRLAPWAHVLMAHDAAWVKHYLHEVHGAGYAGQVFTCAAMRFHGVQSLKRWPKFRGFGNSGAAAVSLAAFCGARAVVMLGFDCQHTGGQTHWHGSHPAPLGDAKSVDRWPLKFAQLADYARRRGCRVINATRETALTCFERMGLDDALAAVHP